MNVDGVDLFYTAMPSILDIGDGSQDALMVRVRSGSWYGWGQCEASPLVSIASLVSPMSYSACKPVQDSILGQRLDGPDDIVRIGNLVRENSFDQLQSAHTWSGIDVAMWDLLGRRFEEPVYSLLKTTRPVPKVPYASVLFGDTPEQTRQRGEEAVRNGFGAVKFGWQNFGRRTLEHDIAQLEAARAGLGPASLLLVDAAMAWGTDAGEAIRRVPALEANQVAFLEEPFVPGAYWAYQALKAELGSVRLAGGEGCHTVEMAMGMIDHCGVDLIQIDAGRIGGITQAALVAEHARRQGISYINHSFTTQLALSASLQPFVGDEEWSLCEYPIDPLPLSRDLTGPWLKRDTNGLVHVPDAPGLGVDVDLGVLERYCVDVDIAVQGETLYSTPSLQLARSADV